MEFGWPEVTAMAAGELREDLREGGKERSVPLSCRSSASGG